MFPIKSSFALALTGLLSISTASPAASGVQVRQSGQTVAVEINGAPFTEYHYQEVSRPFLYPVIGPTGAGMTRNYPMKDMAGEARDHVHHRSLWFTHGNINGIDFWAETGNKEKLGRTVHEKFLQTTSGTDRGIIATQNKLLAADGRQIGTTIFTITFHNRAEDRLIDFDVELKATHGDMTLGDTKEGTMAIRIAETMRLKELKGQPKGQGRIVTSEGILDGAAWGTRAKWVDYHGPVGEKTVGVAIFDHPSNLRHPTWWHVRDYGLFAANPFGRHDFEKLADKEAGKHVIRDGQTLKQKYRFYFHVGDTAAAKVAERYSEWTR